MDTAFGDWILARDLLSVYVQLKRTIAIFNDLCIYRANINNIDQMYAGFVARELSKRFNDGGLQQICRSW